jgi:FkbM family methyltransferase
MRQGASLYKWLHRRRARAPAAAAASLTAELETVIADLIARAPANPAILQNIDERLTELARMLPRIISLRQFASMDRFALETLCRAQAQPLYLGDHHAICRVLSRYKLFLDSRDRGFAAHVLLDGYWEMWLTIFMCRHVRAGMVVVDVGANFGYYTLLLADLVGPSGRTFAIEPNPDVAALLRHSVALNGFNSRTSIVEAAAGDAAVAEVLLYSPYGEYKNACIIESPHQVNTENGALRQVRQVTIDQVVASAPRVDFLKIDAEGAEEAIVDGMCQCILDHKPSFILEFNAARCKQPEQLIRKLTSTYKVVHYLDFHSNLVKTSEVELMSQHVGQDWLLFLDRKTAIGH